MEILIKLGITISGVVLKTIAEKWWHNAQRFVLPLIYSIGVSYLSHCWWIGLTTLPMIAPLCLGYSDYGKNDAVARALWLFVICIVAGLGPYSFGHLPLVFYAPYIVLAGFIGTLTRNINNWIEAPICGFWIVLPIWFIHG